MEGSAVPPRNTTAFCRRPVVGVRLVFPKACVSEGLLVSDYLCPMTITPGKTAEASVRPVTAQRAAKCGVSRKKGFSSSWYVAGGFEPDQSVARENTRAKLSTLAVTRRHFPGHAPAMPRCLPPPRRDLFSPVPTPLPPIRWGPPLRIFGVCHRIFRPDTGKLCTGTRPSATPRRAQALGVPSRVPLRYRGLAASLSGFLLGASATPHRICNMYVR